MLKSLEVCNSLLFLVPFHCGWLVSSNHHGQHSIIDLFLGPGGGGGVCLYNWPFCCYEAYFLMCSALGYPIRMEGIMESADSRRKVEQLFEGTDPLVSIEFLPTNIAEAEGVKTIICSWSRQAMASCVTLSC